MLPRYLGNTIAASSAQPSQTADPFRVEIDPRQVLLGRNGVVTGAAVDASPDADVGAGAPFPIRDWLLIVWVTGAAVVLVRLVASLVGLWSKGRCAVPVTDASATALAERLAARHGIRRRVSLRLAADGTIPATWGFLRPVVLLPADAIDWPDEQVTAVLLHELAHVARGDFLLQTV